MVVRHPVISRGYVEIRYRLLGIMSLVECMVI